MIPLLRFIACSVFTTLSLHSLIAADIDPALQRWLVAQEWVRDTEGPVVSLGAAGSFDDQHIFAPCVAREGGRFLLWYCGSRGTVEDRVFGLGMATGIDGRKFEKLANDPVLEFADRR